MPSPADQKEIVIHVVNRNSRHGPFISPHGGVVMVVTRTSAMAAQNESNAGFSKELTWQLENGILTTESSAVKTSFSILDGVQHVHGYLRKLQLNAI